MALIGEMKYLTIGDSTYYVPSSGGDGYATDSELLDATTIAIWEDILGISEE